MSIIGALIFTLCFAVALWRGGFYQRAATGAYLLSVLLTLLLRADGKTPTTGVVAVDIAAFLILLSLSYKSRAIWLLFAASFQLLTVFGHFASGIAINIGNYAYLSVLNLWGGYGLLLSLIAGLISRPSPDTGGHNRTNEALRKF